MGRAAGSVEVHPVAAQPEPALLAVRARAHREARFPLRRRGRAGPLLLRLLVVVRLMLVWWLLVLVLWVLRVRMRGVQWRRGLDVDRGRRGLAVAVASVRRSSGRGSAARRCTVAVLAVAKSLMRALTGRVSVTGALLSERTKKACPSGMVAHFT